MANLPKIHLGRRMDSMHQADIDIGGPFVTQVAQVDFWIAHLVESA